MSQTKAQLIDPVDGTIVNADINASAAIAGSKISPDFGSQNINTTGQLFSSYATLTAVNPTLTFTDSNNNPDYTINVNSGALNITDSTNSADRLSINSSGNVGIGTSSPATLLHIRASSAPKLRIDDSDTSGVFTLLQDGTNASVHLSSAGTLDIGVTNDNAAATVTFKTRNNERLRIDSSGRLLLGTTTEGVANASKFTIADTQHCGMTIRSGTSHDGQVAFSDGTSGNDEFRGQIRYNHTSNFLAIATDASERMRINSSGNVGIGTASPSARLHVNSGTDNTTLFIESTDGDVNLGMADNAGSCRLLQSAGDLHFRTGGNANAFGTGDDERMVIDSSGNVGIGTASPSARLHVNDGNGLLVERSTGTSIAGFKHSGASAMNVYFQNTGSTNHPSVGSTNQDLTFGTNNTERARIKSNGGIGIHTSNPQVNGKGVHIQNGVVTNAHYDAYVGLIVENTEGRLQIVSTNDGNQASQITLTNAPTTGDNLHWIIEHSAAQANNAFHIGHLTSTSGYPTSVLDTGNFDVDFRILTSGIAQFSNHGSFDAYVSATDAYQMRHNIQAQTVLWLSNTNTSHTRELLRLDSARSGSSQFFLANFTTGNLSDDQFLFRGDGNAFQDGGTTWSTPADYAEMFEWEDGNPNNEDRRGISVVLVGDKIRAATSSDDTSQIIGVISGNPAVTGDGAYTKWHLKYLLDDYNNYILDENGERKLNPDYDSTKTYIPREDRKEWSAVGMLGKLRVKVNQPVGASWIKLKNVSDSVEQWLVR